MPRGVPQDSQRYLDQLDFSDNNESKIEFSVDGTKAIFTFTVDRESVRDVIDRWTFSNCMVIIKSLDKETMIVFPKLQEQKKP